MLRIHASGVELEHTLLHNHSSLSRSYRHILRQPQVREQSLLVITFLRPESPFTTMDAVTRGDIIVYVNDCPVSTIDEYVSEWRRWWEATDEPCVTLTLYDGSIAVAGRSELPPPRPPPPPTSPSPFLRPRLRVGQVGRTGGESPLVTPFPPPRWRHWGYSVRQFGESRVVVEASGDSCGATRLDDHGRRVCCWCGSTDT